MRAARSTCSIPSRPTCPTVRPEAFVAILCGIPDESALAAPADGRRPRELGAPAADRSGLDRRARVSRAARPRRPREPGRDSSPVSLLSGDGESRRRAVAARAIAEPGERGSLLRPRAPRRLGGRVARGARAPGGARAPAGSGDEASAAPGSLGAAGQRRGVRRAGGARGAGVGRRASRERCSAPRCAGSTSSAGTSGRSWRRATSGRSFLSARTSRRRSSERSRRRGDERRSLRPPAVLRLALRLLRLRGLDGRLHARRLPRGAGPGDRSRRRGGAGRDVRHGVSRRGHAVAPPARGRRRAPRAHPAARSTSRPGAR